MGDPLRVLHVVVNMNRGGAETLLMNLYRNIDRGKIQFDFLTSKPGVFDQEILEMGGRIHRIPYISEVGHFGYIKELDNFFKENNSYQIIHSHLDKMSGLVLRAAKKVRIPFRISHSHSTRSEGNFFIKGYKWFIGKYIKRNATNFLACSSESAKWLFQEKKALIIKNGIESEKFKFSPIKRHSIRQDFNIPEESVVFGHVGRFSTPKNHLFLLDVFKDLISLHPYSYLILIGDGPLESKVREKVLDYKLAEKVMFLGTRKDVDELLQAFDIFLFPSLYEGLPVALVEAQVSGLPSLVSDKITKEVDMGANLINFIPLSKEKWIENAIHLIKKNGFYRDYHLQAVLSKGFDIKETSTGLENFYLSLSR